MSAVLGILRAAFRLKGSAVWWSFYLALLAVAWLLQGRSQAEEAARIAPVVAAIGAWMGWCLFLPRIWQLQRHAESLQLPAAERAHPTALVVLGLLGCTAPAFLLALQGANFLVVLVHQLAALASAMLYLLATPILGAVLLAGLFLAMWAANQWIPLDRVSETQWILVMGGFALVAFAINARLWRRVMTWEGPEGWSTPQMVSMTQHLGQAIDSVDATVRDPALHWVWTGRSRISPDTGPKQPLRAIALLLCGPLSPHGMGTYLVNTVWLVLPVLFLGWWALIGKPASNGAPASLIVLVSIWSMGVPLTIITRLRSEWHAGGQALAEAALLPGLHRDDRAWLQAMLAVLRTTVYRVWPPTVLALLILLGRSGMDPAWLGPWLMAGWGSVMMVLLMPIAQREGALATALWFALSMLIVVGLLLGAAFFVRHGVWGVPTSAWVIGLIVATSSVLAQRWPTPNGPFELC